MVRKLRWSFETPIKYMEELMSCMDYLYVLSQHLDDTKYMNLVKEYKDEGGYVIMDNGAYELGTSIDLQLYVNRIKIINPDEVIIPDILYDSVGSDRLTNKFWKVLNENNFNLEENNIKTIGIIHGCNIDEYMKHFSKLYYNEKIDKIGITKIRKLMFGSVFSILYSIEDILQAEGDYKPFHLLGVVNPLEIVMLKHNLENRKEVKAIETIDTGLPINFAVENQLLTVPYMWDDYKHISGVDLDYTGKLDTRLAKINMKTLIDCGW